MNSSGSFYMGKSWGFDGPYKKYCDIWNIWDYNDGIDKEKSFIYFITDSKFVKIGKANDIRKRMDQLSSGNPNELRLLCAIEFSKKRINMLEALLHNHFKKYRVRGEWFDILNQIDTLDKQYRFYDSLWGRLRYRYHVFTSDQYFELCCQKKHRKKVIS